MSQSYDFGFIQINEGHLDFYQVASIPVLVARLASFCEASVYAGRQSE